LDDAQNFPEIVFLGVAMEGLLDDEDIWSPILEYRLESATTFEPLDRAQTFKGVSRGCFHWGIYGMTTL
jgi:hypothetical protein